MEKTFNNPTIRKTLLYSGMMSSFLYFGVVAITPVFWEGYDRASQSVSELFAIGAPSAGFIIPFCILYALLAYAFGAGIWMSAGSKWTIKVTAALIIAKEVLGLIGTIAAPMHLRGDVGSLTDTMHIVATMIGVLLCMFPAIGFGAASFGRGFRLYSIVTMIIFIVFGILAGMDGPNVAANLPTPYLGIWERVNIYAYMVWIVVLSLMLLFPSSYSTTQTANQ